MDTILFLMILGTLLLVMKGSDVLKAVLPAWAVCLLVALWFFDHHVTSSWYTSHNFEF